MASEKIKQEVLSQTSEVPLYRRIEEDLLAQIAEGQLEPGQAIPTERELCERYGVSRITVSRAIGELATRGHVHRYRGKGTFVSRSRIPREMGRLISFSDEMRAQGRVPSTRLLNLQHTPADKSVASRLQMDEGDPIWIVERLRLADDEIISLCASHLHLPSHVYLTPLELSTEGSLWSVLAKKGIQITEGEATIRATVADAHNANLLGVDEGSPSLVREGINYYVEDQPVPVEIFQVISCADRYQYSLHLIRQPVKN
jgi:GntR family transcriptional regulator